MTVLSNLSQKHKIFIIHGMNNNQEGFSSLIREFTVRGYEVESVILPGHDIGKLELTAEEALDRFITAFNMKVHSPYIVVAYSQGALYYELSLNLGKIPKPQRAIYLAPAFYIKNGWFIKALFRFLPKNYRIKSLSPPEVTRYDHMLAHEYKTLIGKIRKLHKTQVDRSIPRLIVIDAKDELVDSKKVRAEYPNETIICERKLKEKFRQHLIFHPKYSSPDDWEFLIKKIVTFIKTN